MRVFKEVSNLQLPSFMDPPTDIKPYIIGTDGKQEITMEQFMTAISLHDVRHYIKENQDTADMPTFMETQSQASSLTLQSSYTRLGDDKSTASNQPLAHLTFNNVETPDKIVHSGISTDTKEGDTTVAFGSIQMATHEQPFIPSTTFIPSDVIMKEWQQQNTIEKQKAILNASVKRLDPTILTGMEVMKTQQTNAMESFHPVTSADLLERWDMRQKRYR